MRWQRAARTAVRARSFANRAFAGLAAVEMPSTRGARSISGTLAVVSQGAFGAYRVVRKIGQGGMGVVYLGEHSLIGRRAAINVLHRHRSAQRENVERFFNEARATSAVSDPGIVHLYDFGVTDDGTAFLVMEFLDGEPLGAR